MGKGHKKNKASSGDKRDAFWASILTEKQKLVREGLVNTGIEAQTRNEQGLTSIMVAALNGKAKSLETLLDWYKRRRLLRQRGWINLTDDDGRTALHMAAGRGHLGCIETLIDYDAKTDWKDRDGRIARDHAVAAKKTEAVKLIDEMLAEPVDDDIGEDGEVINDGLTSTQRNKLKKKQMKALERRGMKEESDEEEESDDGGSLDPGPKPIWNEVQKVVDSIENLKELKEIKILREEPEEDVPGGVDPALWYLRGINKLEMRLAPEILVSVDGADLARLRKLSTLILNNNSLASLPDEIGNLKHLKFLELSHNKLSSLPATMSKLSKLQLLNLDSNQFKSLGSLEGLSSLSTLRASNNMLEDIDFDYENLGRLTSVSISSNKVSLIPLDIQCASGMTHFEAEGNLITEIPYEFSTLKRLKVIKFAGNPIKDPKVKKLLAKEGKLKDLWKYIEKTSGGKKKLESPSKQKQKARAIVKEEDEEGFDSDDSFDITMEEL